jgi:hypothetical protein
VICEAPLVAETSEHYLDGKLDLPRIAIGRSDL